MKKFYILISILLVSWTAEGHHIIGGEMSYAFVSKDGKNYTYEVMLKLYRGCEPVDGSHAELNAFTAFCVFNNDDHNALFSITDSIPLHGPNYPDKQRNDPCIIDPPAVCYQIGYYKALVTVPVNKKGYTIAWQRSSRSDHIINVDTRGSVGASYFTILPGTENGILGDNGPIFSKEEAVLICSHGPVDYNCAATDADGDSLTYAFHTTYVGGSGAAIMPVPCAPPPYKTITYMNGFSATHPLGPGVTIDARTGEIRGRTDLEAGTYDICVAVQAHRGGRVIATHLKDLQFEVHDCDRVVLADIPPLFNECRGMKISFSDNSTPGKSYLWDFGDGDTSTAYKPVHEYRDTGVYHVWLKVEPNSPCGDSIAAEARIYPTVRTLFGHDGNCAQFPVSFKDSSLTTCGKINSWRWDFAGGDTSLMKDPVHRFAGPGTYQIGLTVTTDKGCLQRDTQSVQVYGKPAIAIIPDTTICLPDAIQLQAAGSAGGSYAWGPGYRITGAISATPIVSPETDTTYRVAFTDVRGCVNTDSVHIDVRKHLAVHAAGDTTICQGDPVRLYASGDGKYAYSWSNSHGDATGKGADVTTVPEESGIYVIDATLGTCDAKDTMRVTLVPYPDVSVTPDTTICNGDRIRLHAGGGAFYRWSPSATLSDSTTASPLASPADSTLYVVTVTDTVGCPKPSSTHVMVSVLPQIRPSAGRDTTVVLGIPFRLRATGGNAYSWSPSIGLSDPYVADPVIEGAAEMTYRVKVAYEPEGCFAYDTVHVRFMKGPTLYAPTAFTPNGDGTNDVFRPFPVGISDLDYFRVYNRWGRLVFRTKTFMQGWDGTFNGTPASAGSYVWMAGGKDKNGKDISRRGSVLLIR